MWNTFGTVAVRDVWENGCVHKEYFSNKCQCWESTPPRFLAGVAVGVELVQWDGGTVVAGESLGRGDQDGA